MTKRYRHIKDTSKTYPKIDSRKLAKALGAKLVTDSQQIKEFEKKDLLSHPLLPKVNKSSRALTIQCQKHPRYRAVNKSRTKCVTCHLLYILRWHNSKEGPDRLGGLNPFQFIIDGYQQLEDACVGLKISEK